MKIGYSKIDITPKFSVELGGYGFYLNRKSEGIHDPLYAKSIYLNDGENEILLISCDLIGINRENIVRIKEKISNNIGISSQNITISSTHTHSGPATLYLEGLGKISRRYMVVLEEKILKSAVNAKLNSSEGKIGFIETEVDIAYNRTKQNGPYDKSLRIMFFENKKEKIFLYNYNAHCISLSHENRLFTCDWPFYTNEKIKNDLNCESIFFQGFCGDINIKEGWQRDFEKAKFYGEKVGEEILKVINKLEYKDNLKIKNMTEIINLPLKIPTKKDVEEFYNEFREKEYRNWDKFLPKWKKITLYKIDKNCRDFLPTEIQFICFSDICSFFVAPGEIFTIFGLELKKLSFSKYNFLFGYSNDYVGYIPDEEDFKEKRYASTIAPLFTTFFPFKENVGEVLIDSFKEILKNLKGGGYEF
ncbi:MAG: neutral/alkaline non-lysosomal ceramidase N-terminal domain-containing protein [Candidatus Omnitrophica bacterium]|nr:neutral/alkaline non-lysosomal ceramidase N-terminal domain-containing protein [Candidatus Omnitrophota bacterium]